MTGPPRWDAVYRSAHVSDRALSKRDRVIDGQVELIRLQTAWRELVRWAKLNPDGTAADGITRLLKSGQHGQCTERALGFFYADPLK